MAVVQSGFTSPFTAKTKLTGKDSDTRVHVISAIPVVTQTRRGISYKIEALPEMAKYGETGYIADLGGKNSIIIKLLEKAQQEGQVLTLRFEKKRKQEEDYNTSIADLTATKEIASKKIVNVMTGVYNYNKKEWVLSVDAQSDPADDPQEVKAFLSQSVVEDLSDDDIEQFFDVSTNNTPTTTPSSTPSFNPSTPKLEKTNALISVYFFVKGQLAKNNLDIQEEKARQLSVMMLGWCDDIQRLLTDNQNVYYGAYSHTKARAVIFGIIENMYPFTEENLADFSKWSTCVMSTARSLVSWSKTV